MDSDVLMDRLTLGVRELTEPRRTVEAVPGWTKSRHRTVKLHTVTHPPLLAALGHAVMPGAGLRHKGVRTAPGSRPPIRLDAIDAQALIVRGVAQWTQALGNAPRGTVAKDLRGMVGTLSGAVRYLDAAVKSVQGWVTLCRVVSGWETPAFAPRGASCPVCEGVGGLRVRWETETAVCLRCGVSWGALNGSIYVLAEHIRQSRDGVA